MEDNKPLVLSGLESLRLLSAFQILSVPSGMMGVTHKRAREVIAEMTGKAPERGTKFPPGASLESLLAIHLGCEVKVTEGVAQEAT
jgi:hypothetical protein